METPIDWTRPVRTKGAKQPVRIISTNGPAVQPIVGVMVKDDELCNWSTSGIFAYDGKPCGLDLENA